VFNAGSLIAISPNLSFIFFLRVLPASGPLAGHGGASECPRAILQIRRRGAPLGVAALLVRGGMGETAPILMFSIFPLFSGKPLVAG